MDASETDRVSLREIMSTDLVCVRPDLDIENVVNVMISRHVGCLPVVDERRRPIGIVTKFDIVEKLDAAFKTSSRGCALPRDLLARTADDVMMPVVFTLDENSTVAHASRMMVIEDTHHVLVTEHGGALVGVVSTKDIVRWLATARSTVPACPSVAARCAGPGRQGACHHRPNG